MRDVVKHDSPVTIGDDGDGALTPLISSSPSSPPTESATVATIATIAAVRSESFALARFWNRWYNEIAKEN